MEKSWYDGTWLNTTHDTVRPYGDCAWAHRLRDQHPPSGFAVSYRVWPRPTWINIKNSSLYKWIKILQNIAKEEWWSPLWNPENSPATSAMAQRSPRSGPFWSPQVWPATDKRSVAHQCHDPRHSCSRPWESLGLADWDLQALVDIRWYYKSISNIGPKALNSFEFHRKDGKGRERHPPNPSESRLWIMTYNTAGFLERFTVWSEEHGGNHQREAKSAHSVGGCYVPWWVCWAMYWNHRTKPIDSHNCLKYQSVGSVKNPRPD